MSTSAISGISAFNYNNQSVQNEFQQFRQEFQQLGQDLQSGNLSAAQQDFVTLQQLAPQSNSTSSTQSNSTSSTQSSNPIAQEFNQLSQALQSGNLSAAQQDYSQIQQDFQSQSAQGHHHHHHHGGGSGSSQISQLFNQLGQALQSGNLSSAQQAYATLQQDFQQLSASSGQNSGTQSSQSNPNTVAVSS